MQTYLSGMTERRIIIVKMNNARKTRISSPERQGKRVKPNI